MTSQSYGRAALAGDQDTAARDGRSTSRAGVDGVAMAAPRARRNPKWIAAGLVAICLGGLASFALFTQATGDTSVVAVSHAVSRGTTIERGDLVVVKIGSIPGLQTVPADELGSMVGRRTAVDLTAGSLLPPTASSADPLPAAGRSIVGVRLADGRAPVGHLPVGSPIRLVAVPADGTGAADLDDQVFVARVVDQTGAADGQSVLLSVDTSSDQAATISRLAAQDRLSVVRDSEG